MLTVDFFTWVASGFAPSHQWLWDRIGDGWNLLFNYLSWLLHQDLWMQVILIGVYFALALWLFREYVRDNPTASRRDQFMNLIVSLLWLPVMAACFTLVVVIMFYGFWLVGIVTAFSLALAGFVFEAPIRGIAALFGR